VPIRRQQEWTIRSKSPATARVASVHGFIGNIPSPRERSEMVHEENENRKRSGRVKGPESLAVEPGAKEAGNHEQWKGRTSSHPN